MTEEKLLAAINLAPEDISVRLVYADWLEEQGREEDARLARRVRLIRRSETDPNRNIRYKLCRKLPDINGCRLHCRKGSHY